MRFSAANKSFVAGYPMAIIQPWIRPWILVWTLLCDQASGQSQSARPEMDRVELIATAHAEGGRYEGLIEAEETDSISLIRIIRQPGKQMHLVIQPIERREIADIERLDESQRARLKEEIDQFRNRASIEAMRMDAVRLQPRSLGGTPFLHYEGRWFQLDSAASDRVTRLIVVRTEQIFAAYRQILAPRARPKSPPRLVVFASFSSYQSYLKTLGVKIENQACFLEDKNAVVIGSDLTRAGDMLSVVLKRNDACRKQLASLKQRLEQRLREVAVQYKQQGLSNAEVNHAILIERAKFAKQLAAAQDDLRKSDLEVARVFKDQMGQTFVRLYHESFHAYLRNYLYPREEYDVPLWLNEGLAVIFQGGMLEGNTLRVDAPNPEFLKLLKTELAADRALPLSKLLEAKESRFLFTDSTLPAEINRYYAYAWGVTYCLVYDRKLFDTPALERYVKRSAKASSPGERFEGLVGEPLDRFEAGWRQDMLSLGKRDASSGLGTAHVYPSR